MDETVEVEEAASSWWFLMTLTTWPLSFEAGEGDELEIMLAKFVQPSMSETVARVL